MKVFENKEITESTVFDAVFSAPVDTFCLTSNGKFLLVCLKNGQVLILDLFAEDNKNVFSEFILNNESSEACYICCFVENFEDENIIRFIVVSYSGLVYRVSMTITVDFEEAPTKNINHEKIHSFRGNIIQCTFSYPILFANGSEMHMLDLDNNSSISDIPYDLKDVYPIGQKFLGLDTTGNLLRICSLTMLIFPIESVVTLFEDISVISEADKIQIAAVTKKNEEGNSYIQLLSYPEFTPIFSIVFPHSVKLIQLESLSDEFFFISQISTGKTVSELRLQCVYETEPELRLQRLIKKQRFDDAEKFAAKFHVDPMVITKARARLISEKLICDSKDVDNLINILNTIDDDIFKLECCRAVDCAEAEDVRRLLSYGSTLVIKNCYENKEDIQVLQKAMMDLLFKFDTYMAINSEYDSQAWETFASCDLFQELKTLLKNCQIEEAIILFSRLDVCSIEKLTVAKIEEIILILNSLHPNFYQPFLSTFIPITMNYRPEALSLFVKWLHSKIYQLEKRGSYDFPESAISFAEYVIKLLKVNTFNMLFQRQCTLDKDCLNELSNLIAALKDMQTLKNNFRINIRLSEYLMGPKTVIRILLNVELNPADYEIFIKSFLYPYILRSQYQPNEILLEEIMNFLKYDEEYWLDMVEIILNFISSIEIKLIAINNILENASVPWCSKVKEISQSAFQYSHPLVSKIKDTLEDEPRLLVLRNRKYNFKEKLISTKADLHCVVNQIVYKNQPSYMSDAYNLCKSASDRNEVNIILMRNCIKKGNLEEAISILDKNEPEDCYNCCKWFASYSLIVIDDDFCSYPKLKENYYKISDLLFKRLLKNTKCSLERKQYECELIMVKAIYNINKSFQTKVRAKKLIVPREKMLLFEEIIQEVVENFQNKVSPSIIDIVSNCHKLAEYLSIPKDTVIVKFCEKIENFKLILDAANYLYENDSDSKSLCLIAILLLKLLGATKLSTFDCSFGNKSDEFLVPNTNDIANNDFLSGLEIAGKLAGKAMLKATSDDHSAVLEVLKWVDTGFYLTRCTQHPWKNDNVYGNAAFSAINGVFNMYCSYIEQFKNPNLRYLTFFSTGPCLSQDQFLKELSNLPMTICELCQDNQHLTAFNLLLTLQQGLFYATNNNPELTKTLDVLIKKQCVIPLINVVASAKHLDSQLFFNLLLMCGEGFVKSLRHRVYLKSYRRQPRKYCKIAQVILKLMDIYQIKDGEDRMDIVNNIRTCKWWRKIENSKIEYDVFFKSTAIARLELLMTNDCIDAMDIKEYCADYDLNAQSSYLSYLKLTLTNWKPEVEYNTDLSGKKNLVVKNDEKQLLAKCIKIIEVISSKELIVKLIQKISGTINFYYYEVFIVIMEILRLLVNTIESSAKERELNLPMLQFLKSYRRFSPPSHSEKESWYGTFPFAPFIDPLSEFRLPFTKTLFTNVIWDIIKPEVNLKTYKCWFEAIDILKKSLSQDEICIYAVKEVVSSGALVQDPSVTWNLYPKYEDLFSQINECAKHISNIERVTALVYHVMTHMPLGADKVNMARLSYDYAIRYKENFPGNSDVEATFKKVKQKYYIFSAMHILYKYQLADDKYLQLVGQPRDLINNLYLDERILKRAECVNLSCPDINKAVDALGELFEMDIFKVRYDILNNWLNNSATDVDLDSTFTMPINSRKSQSDNDDYLKRASYICLSSDTSYWPKYLLHSGIEEGIDSGEKSLSFKAKALKCFCAISDVDDIIAQTGTSYEEFLNYIDKVTLLSDLKSLGFSYDIETLDNYNKKELLKRLSRYGTAIGIKVMAALCITYSIDDLRYWEFIVNSAIKLEMFGELRSYVDFLKNKCFKSFYINAWQVIIDHSFQINIELSTEDAYETYVNNFLMIQSCPVLYSVNFENIVRQCITSGKTEFAVVLLQYLPEEKKALYAKEIRSTTLFKDLEKLQKKGVYGIKKAKSYLESVMKKTCI